jgi:hypothetical protein
LAKSEQGSESRSTAARARKRCLQSGGRDGTKSKAARQAGQSCLKLYSQLKKAESSVLFQARTGRIGFRRFLAFVRVPGVESDECLCEKGKETAEHVLLHCDNTPQRVWSRGAQFQKLVSEPAAVSQIARQLI